LIEPDELEAVFSPGDHERINWFELLQLCARATPETRLAHLRTRLQQLGQGKQRSRRGWSKNVRRDQILVVYLGQGKSAVEICEALDNHLIPTTENMQKHGIATWVAACKDGMKGG
jgi:hypothetical protein